MTEYLKKDPQCKHCIRKKSPEGIQTTIILTDKITPKLIDREKWLIEREKIRTSFKKYYQKKNI
mgnify:CR=1 FL=1